MIGVIVASRKVGINPDNVATPIAASLGDLITLSLLAGISTGLYKELGNGNDKHTHRSFCFFHLKTGVRSIILPGCAQLGGLNSGYLPSEILACLKLSL